MLGNKQNGFLNKLGINGRDVNSNNEPLRFFKPTANSLYSIGRKGEGQTGRGMAKLFSA